MNNYLIYLAYGNEDHLNELYYSLLSFYKFQQNNAISIIIYTDNEAFLKKYFPSTIIIKSIDNETIVKWKGTIQFNHRVKVKVLQDVASNYNGNFLYLDTDTYFTNPILHLFETIDNNGVVMDLYEGKLIENKGGIARKTRSILKKQNQFFLTSHSEKVIIDDHFEVWNAGVIGFNSNFSKLHLVEELVDQLYTAGRLFVMEQIAFNYFLQQHQTPFSAENYIHHYWYFKEFRSVLRHFFQHHQGKTFDELIDKIDPINPQLLSNEKIAYKKLSFFEKQKHKLLKGRKWEIANYKL